MIISIFSICYVESAAPPKKTLKEENKMRKTITIIATLLICHQHVALGLKGGGESSGGYQSKINPSERLGTQGGGESLRLRKRLLIIIKKKRRAAEAASSQENDKTCYFATSSDKNKSN